MKADRGITLTQRTILRWVPQYLPEFGKRWSQQFSERSDGGIVDLAERLDAEERLWRRQMLEEYIGPKQ